MVDQSGYVPHVAVDLDDTVHTAEGYIFANVWNKFLHPWDFGWVENGYHPPGGVRYIQPNEKPGVGMRPLEVFQHFINMWDLDPRKAHPVLLQELRLDQKQLQLLSQNWDSIPKGERTGLWAQTLESARVGIQIDLVREIGVIEVPGALNMLGRFKEQGFAVSVVTSGPTKYALEVMQRLQLAQDGPNGFESQLIDGFVAGDMVRNPKPDPEGLRFAEQIVHERSGLNGRDLRTVAIIGDSFADAGLARNAGVMALIRPEHLQPDDIRLMKENMGDRLHLFDDWEKVDPSLYIEGSIGLEGKHGRGPEF